MKNLRTAITVSVLTIVLSSSAMAGNIAMRTNAMSSTEAAQAHATSNTDSRNESSALGKLAILVKGNIGLIVTVLLP